MVHDPAYITTLILRHLKGEVTPEEAAVLQEALGSMEHYPEFAQEVLDADTVWQRYSDLQRFKDEKIQEKILERIGLTIDFRQKHAPAPRIPLLKRAWFRYVAVLLLIVGTATFIFLHNQPQKETAPAILLGNTDIPPGGNKAILTLSDGSIVVLDSADNGALAQEGSTKVVKLHTGLLAYEGTGNPETKLYNTLATPKGGLYQVGLPDGSRAWLNAASSITFPTAFGNERSVTITGEVYFEVVANKVRPFFVNAGATTIQVLGTSFNVNAYTDEPSIKASLLEGSIKIGGTVLQPGQAFTKGKIIPTNTEQDIAWKNGVFDFNKISLEKAMRQIANWYDVDIVYESGIPPITFWGEMGRNLNLSQVLAFLKDMGVHFRLEAGRRLVILP